MKFKKSHIFLIALISLFMLLGMSAVSAAADGDNIAQDMSIDDISASEDIDNIENDIIDADVLSDEGDGNTEPTNPDEPGTGENGDETGTPTAILSSNETYSFGSNITFDANVTAGGEPISVSAENLKVSYTKAGEDNYTDMNFTLNNESKIIFKFLPQKTLPIGDYIVKIQFLNSTIEGVYYTESETNVTLNITKSDTTINASDVKVSLGNDIIIPLTIKLESNKTLNVNAKNITVVYIINEENIWEFNVTNGTGGNNVSKNIKLINANFTEVGNYSIVIVFKGTDNCNPSNATITLSILANNTIKVNDTVKVNNSNKTVTIPFSVINTQIVNVTDPETQENTTELKVTNLTVTKDDLKLIISYDNGTENITEEIENFEFTDEDGNYSITFTPELEFNTDFYKVNLTIVYKEGDLSETNKTIGLEAFAEIYIVPVLNETEYQFGEFKFMLVDGNGQPLANCNVTLSGFTFFSFSSSGGVSLTTSKVLTSDEEGYIVFNDTFMHNDVMIGLSNIISSNFTALPAGTYNATFAAKGFFALDNKTEITVNKIEAKIIASNLVDEYGKVIKYVFQLVKADTNEVIKAANVQFVINASNIDAVRNGTTNLTGWYTSPDLNLTAGTYNLTLNSIDSNLICSAVKKTLTLKQRKAVLTASNRTIYYNSGYSAIVKLTDKKTGKAVANAYVMITVYTTSKKYTNFLGKTNKNGKIYLSTPLAVGKHKITFTCVDNNYNASSITRYLTVKKASGKFTAKKVTTYYRSGKNFQIKLTNTKNSKAIYYGNVNIKVYISKNKYYNLTGATDGNGIVKLKINYKPGTYKVVVSSADKGYTAKSITRQIKVTKAPIKMAPTTLKVKKGKYFKVKVTSTKSKKVLSSVKIKVKVYTGKKFKTYTIKTNKKGIASLKIKQKVGKHKVVLTPASTKYYTGKKVTKTIKVTK